MSTIPGFRFDNTRLLVRDFPACFNFYKDVLGLTVQMGDADDAYAAFEAPGGVFGLFHRKYMAPAVGDERPEHAQQQDPFVLCFQVDDVDAAFATLRDRGAAVAAEPTDRAEWMQRTAHFRDPDGNLIELYTPLPSDHAHPHE